MCCASKRRFFAPVALSLLTLVGFAFACFADQPLSPRRPNVLFLMIDDLNDWIGCLGHSDAKTPHMDRLAREGMLFTRAFAPSASCNPSRVSILTGRHPSTTGIYRNLQQLRWIEDVVTLPQHFKANGYVTMGGGKIGHDGYPPDAESWVEYFPSMEQAVPVDPKPSAGAGFTLLRHNPQFSWGPLDVADEEMGDAKVAHWAVEQLGKRYDAPFFLAVGFYRPHLPWHVPRPWFEMYPPEDVSLPSVNENDWNDLPPLGVRYARRVNEHEKILKVGKWRNAVAAYLASVSFVDAQVGKVLDALAKSSYANNTIVVLLSDHGWHLGEKLHWTKFTLWEEATRVPLIISAPGLTAAGSRCHRAVGLIDLFPTLVDLCGIDAYSGLEGRSLRPLLENPEASWNHPALTTHHFGNQAVRTERWRYIRYTDGSEELYDHDEDDNEWTNLAGVPDHGEIKKQLSRLIVEDFTSPLGEPKGKKSK